MSKPERVLCGGDARAPPPNFLPFVSGEADAFRNRGVSASEHACDTPARATDPTVTQSESGKRRPDAGRHYSRVAGTGTKFPAFARGVPATHYHQSLPSAAAWLPHQANARTGGNAMRWIYDACGNADLEEVAFAERVASATSPRRPCRMPMRWTTSLRGKPCSPLFSERPSCRPVTPPPRGRRDLGRWCPSDIRCDGDSCSIPYPRARRKRPTGVGAQCASALTPPHPPTPVFDSLGVAVWGVVPLFHTVLTRLQGLGFACMPRGSSSPASA
jgi:hypothetical protein